MTRLPDPFAGVPLDVCMRAHAAVARAKRGGILTPKACERCRDASRKTVAHHEDYYAPLDVTWLCLKCHRARHSELRRKAKPSSDAAA